MKNKIQETFNQIISKTTIHGLPNILNARHLIIRIVWLLFTLLAGSVCIYLIVSSIQNYFKYDVVTLIQEWPKNPFNFPTISFCNLNQPKTNYTLDDILIDCMFDGRQCSANSFTQFHDLYYGLCYRFNEQGLLSVKRPGKINSFQVYLFVGLVDDYFELGSTTIGAHVYIHNHSCLPSANEGVDVSTGFKANIILKQIFTKRLTKPYNDCEDSPKYFESNLFDGMNEIAYRQRDCYDLKFLEYFSKQCNFPGNIANITRDFRTRIVDSDSKAFECLLISNAEFYSQNITDLYSKDCPNECDSISFASTVSMAKFPSYTLYKDLSVNPKLLKLFRGNFNYQKLSESIVSFSVYYEDLKYTEISQDVKTNWVDLVSNIGGLLGLFLGMSDRKSVV